MSNMNTTDQQIASDVFHVYNFTVFPDNLNYAGTLFGGKLLAEMDLAAANSARRLLYGTAFNGMVTVHLSEVDFINPAHLGDIIQLSTFIVKLGNSSITVGVRAESENMEGSKQIICTAQFVMVALKDGKPFNHGKQLR